MRYWDGFNEREVTVTYWDNTGEDEMMTDETLETIGGLAEQPVILEGYWDGNATYEVQ
jgi:hypothetical protein